MNKVIFAILMLFSVGVFADSTGPCFGPAGCIDTTVIDKPTQLCVNAEFGCTYIYYVKEDYLGDGAAWFAIAQSTVQGYPVIGSAGPCLLNEDCPNIYRQAYESLRTNALMANRAMRFISSD